MHLFLILLHLFKQKKLQIRNQAKPQLSQENGKRWFFDYPGKLTRQKVEENRGANENPDQKEPKFEPSFVKSWSFERKKEETMWVLVM
jgi:hypothetical protein